MRNQGHKYNLTNMYEVSKHFKFFSMIECQNNYALDCVRKLIQSGYKSMECKQEPFDKFYDDLFKMMKLRVFGDGGCTGIKI